MQINYCGLIYRFSACTTAHPCSVGQVTAVFGASGRAANEPNTRLDNSHLLLLSCLCQTQQHPPSLTGLQQQPASHLGRTSSCENLNTYHTHQHSHRHEHMVALKLSTVRQTHLCLLQWRAQMLDMHAKINKTHTWPSMVLLAGVTASNHCLHLFWKLNLVFHSFRVVNIALLFFLCFLRGLGEKHAEQLADSLLCFPVSLTFKVFSIVTVWLTSQRGKNEREWKVLESFRDGHKSTAG